MIPDLGHRLETNGSRFEKCVIVGRFKTWEMGFNFFLVVDVKRASGMGGGHHQLFGERGMIGGMEN